MEFVTMNVSHARRIALPAISAANRSFLRMLSGFLLMLASLCPLVAQEEQMPEKVNDTKTAASLAMPSVRLIAVPLPLTGLGDDRVVAAVEQAVARFPKLETGSARPLLVFEFLPAESSAGEGSEFEAALKLARIITSERLAGVRTVAFLPRSVKGHAALAVIACEEIMMAPAAEFGAAGSDESTISPLLRAGYEEIANRRRTVPAALALGMLERGEKLLKVQTLEGVRIIAESELESLEKSTTVSAVATLKPAGEFAVFTGNSWRHELGYVSHLASDHEQLAAALKIPPAAFSENPLVGANPNAVRINFDGSLNPRLVDRAIKIMGTELQKPDVNLLVLWLRSEGGSLDEALRLARYLVFEVDHARVRTVVYVSNKALGAAAIVALAGDELVIEEGAVLGGEGITNIPAKKFEAAIPQLRELMAQRDRAWSPMLALAGSTDSVRKFSHVKTGEKKIFFTAEHTARPDQVDWVAEVQPLNLTGGIGSGEAVEYGLAQHRTRQFDEIKSLYRIEGEIPVARINWALVFIERLADRRLSALLLFIGTFALFNELAHPGIGVPGFIASVCFMLFFWANFLHGNADMLELLLFAAGIACMVVEMFVAPGAIIFGLGGALMIVTSIVLASQTFVLPTNMYQLRQVPGSLFMVIGAGAGGLIGILVLQRYLPHTPYFKKLILRPPVPAELVRVQERETIASYDHLLGKYGVAVTPLVPSGKILTGDKVIDVVSDGMLIEAGKTVMVVETLGSRVVVREA